jgi:hypothetical protein
LDDYVTNILAMGAHERTTDSIALTQGGAAGFINPGDRMCWKIKVCWQDGDVGKVHASWIRVLHMPGARQGIS